MDYLLPVHNDGAWPSFTSARMTCDLPPHVVGTCSCCGGRVAVPSFVQVGVTDTTPTCLDCGAKAAPPPLHGPLVQTVKR